MNDQNIIQTPHHHVVVMGRLAAIALLGLMLWLGGVTSVKAQSIPPSSPCPLGLNSVAPGWTNIESADCSDTRAWHSHPTILTPWPMGDVPPTPGGHTTFSTFYSSGAFHEGMSTTITGLQAGVTYNVSVFFNGNWTRTCSGAVTINGVSMPFPAPSGNTWTERLFSFVATGPTAAFSIRSNLSPSIGCVTNVYVANFALPVADVQIVKTVSPTGAVASGSVLTYTLIATNNGPSAATNVELRDVSGAGLNCNTPSTTATCIASGGASCPSAIVPVSSLTGGGVILPSLPVGGQVVVTMRCTVTATGR